MDPLDSRTLYNEDLVQDKSERNHLEKVKWTKLLILSGISTTVGASIPVGYNIGVVNTPSNIVKRWCNETLSSTHEWHLTPSQLDILWSSVVSIFLIGGMTGSLGGAWLADKVGRKGALIVSGISGLCGSVFFLLSKMLSAVILLLLGRLFVGLSSGLVTAVMPMYLTEISPSSFRGAMGVLCQLGITFGVLLGQIVGLPFILGTESMWHVLFAFTGVPILLGGLGAFWLPESPKYLFQIRGLKQRAMRELARIQQVPVNMLADELEGNSSPTEKPWKITRLLATPSLYLHLALVCALQGGQQFSGINAVFYYSVSIFEKAGLSHTGAQYATLGAGLMNFFVALCIVPVINHFPRRNMALLSCSTSTVTLVALTITITFMDSAVWISYMSVVAVLAFVLLYGLGLGPIPYFIASELFDVGPRPGAMALGSVSNWTGNFVVGMTFPSLQRAIGQYSFLIFATTTALLTVFLKLCLPETNPRVLGLRAKVTSLESPDKSTGTEQCSEE